MRAEEWFGAEYVWTVWKCVIFVFGKVQISQNFGVAFSQNLASSCCPRSAGSWRVTGPPQLSSSCDPGDRLAATLCTDCHHQARWNVAGQWCQWDGECGPAFCRVGMVCLSHILPTFAHVCHAGFETDVTHDLILLSKFNLLYSFIFDFVHLVNCFSILHLKKSQHSKLVAFSCNV